MTAMGCLIQAHRYITLGLEAYIRGDLGGEWSELAVKAEEIRASISLLVPSTAEELTEMVRKVSELSDGRHDLPTCCGVLTGESSTDPILCENGVPQP